MRCRSCGRLGASGRGRATVGGRAPGAGQYAFNARHALSVRKRGCLDPGRAGVQALHASLDVRYALAQARYPVAQVAQVAAYLAQLAGQPASRPCR